MAIQVSGAYGAGVTVQAGQVRRNPVDGHSGLRVWGQAFAIGALVYVAIP